MILLLAARLSHATCTTLVDDDLTDGTADGDVSGGTFTGEGWMPDGGTMVYSLPYGVDTGQFTITLAGLEEAGLSQNDVAEMFTGPYGSFSDGEVYTFLQLKMAGDVYDGYAGRIKMQIGGEYADEPEMAEWSDERDWNPADTHTITVTWGDGWAEMEHDGVVVSQVDYSAHNGGIIPLESLRIPNDGWYAYDPVADELRYKHVTLCGEPEVVPAAPSITSFDVQPRELAQPATLSFAWDVAGLFDTLQVCARARSNGDLICGEVSGASGSTAVASDVLFVDTWDLWLEAAGDGGTTTSALIPVTVHEPGWVPSTDDGGDPADTDTVEPPPEDAGGDTEGDEPTSDPRRTAGLPGTTTPMQDGGCGCAHGPATSLAWGLAAAILAWSRSRRDAGAPPP